MITSIATIEDNCAELADLRGKLRKKFEAKQKAQSALDAEHNPDIRALQQQCNQARAVILANLSAGRELFVKPKMREFHGITVGFEKERDSVIVPDDNLLVDRIEKLLPAKQAETILDRTVKVIKAAFKKLPREALQKLGCQVVAGADKAIVRATDDDIEILVQKTLGATAD
ncbi:MAG: hypothetical protein KGL39_13190 [Patescibacteria group bacterium]|nr:hypothetical protein [Patescibacteria group bacterium]